MLCILYATPHSVQLRANQKVGHPPLKDTAEKSAPPSLFLISSFIQREIMMRMNNCFVTQQDYQGY